MSRPRSIHARKAPQSQKLTALARLLGRPDAGLLEAALEPADAQAIQERATAERPETLLVSAIGICLEAHDIWQRLSTAQRVHVRGFSLQLLGLAADQTLALERAVAENAALSAEHTLAVTRLRELVPRGALLAAQAAQVLERVAGEPTAQQGGETAPANTTFTLAQNLHRLAHAGHELLQSAQLAVRKRAMLYGLNEAFLDGIAEAGAEIVRVNEKASGTGPLQNSRAVLDRAHRATFFLAAQIADSFATAHKLETTIPALSTVLARRPAPVRETREARVVVLNLDEPKGVELVRYGRPPERVVVPAPAPRVIDVTDFGASGVIRKRSKPPLR